MIGMYGVATAAPNIIHDDNETNILINFETIL